MVRDRRREQVAAKRAIPATPEAVEQATQRVASGLDIWTGERLARNDMKSLRKDRKRDKLVQRQLLKIVELLQSEFDFGDVCED